MKTLKTKYLLLLSFLFFLDLFRPFGYSLSAELLFLGIIFMSLNERLFPALILSVFFGLLSDLFSPELKPLRAIEFPLICFTLHYLMSFFSFASKKKQVLIVKNSLVALALIIHLTFNTLIFDLILPFFWVKFLMQSSLVYLFMSYFLDKNITPKKNRAFKDTILK